MVISFSSSFGEKRLGRLREALWRKGLLPLRGYGEVAPRLGGCGSALALVWPLTLPVSSFVPVPLYWLPDLRLKVFSTLL
jgi:hypothetical protein